eukprot:NODE_4023_length_849_cov_21.651250_g1822_i2.p4 GENE.NODE_4023_length_849_cov_21.651250_g1822_i2~~NODE_4023_length_849_cov_21.651250_g1822_i2.p4  ORF type:complete len:62 (-),score=6.26 NODE_4023_length_849_cov_21.651250_g1822_i2:73-258(-)
MAAGSRLEPISMGLRCALSGQGPGGPCPDRAHRRPLAQCSHPSWEGLAGLLRACKARAVRA